MIIVRTVRSAVLWISAAVGLFSILVFAVVMIVGLKPAVVTSGSMEPTLPVGSLILTRATATAEVRVGDIVTVPREDETLVTHRVVAIEQPKDGPTELTLRGDANETDDSAPYLVNEVGEHVVTIPVLGTIALAIRTPVGLVTIVGGLLVVFLLSFWNPEPRGSRGQAPPIGDGAVPIDT